MMRKGVFRLSIFFSYRCSRALVFLGRFLRVGRWNAGNACLFLSLCLNLKIKGATVNPICALCLQRAMINE